MGTELMRVCLREDNDDFPSVPPGFESFASLSLKRVNESEKQDSENRISSSAAVSSSESHSVPMVTNTDTGEVAKRSVRRRPWTNHGRQNDKSDYESDSERREQVVFQCSSVFSVSIHFHIPLLYENPIPLDGVSYTLVIAEFSSKISSSQGGYTRMSTV